MRTTFLPWMATGLLMASIGPRIPADDRPRALETEAEVLERSFRETVRPFLEAYCLGCHAGDKPKGDMNLSGFRPRGPYREPCAVGAGPGTARGRDHAPGEGEAAADGRGPRAVVAWIGAVRRLEATRNAGDPGPVPARRLSNAEYDNTIRDLTGVDLRPTRSSPSTRRTRPASTTRPSRWPCRPRW